MWDNVIPNFSELQTFWMRDIFWAGISLAVALTVVELRTNTNLASYVIARSSEEVAVFALLYNGIVRHYNGI